MGKIRILGLSYYYHDSAACLIEDGQIIAAAQEERFTRKKHDAEFPIRSIEYCLSESGVGIEEVDHVIYYEKPFLKLDRIISMQINSWPWSLRQFLQMQEAWIGKKIKIPHEIRKRLSYKGPILFCRHHESHAAAAFFCSPLDRATIVTLDGVGEWTTASIYMGEGSTITPIREIRFPDSLGLFYSAFTCYLGFEANEDEYKVMGLAPYGVPTYLEQLKQNVIQLYPDGSFKLNRDYFSFERSNQMLVHQKIQKLFGFGPRKSGDIIRQEHQNLAASVQAVLEEAIVSLCSQAVSLTGERKICLAGGVALNCTANAKLRNYSWVEDLFVFPAAGDAGSCIGAALFAYFQILGHKRNPTPLGSVNFGPGYSQEEVDRYLCQSELPHKKYGRTELLVQVASMIRQQKVVGWFQGKMEFGPRALGNRSILGDPTRKENWKKINQKVKFREDFRPLAPAVTADQADHYFEIQQPSPFMLLTSRNKTALLPAVTHVDGSSRLQTVNRKDNPLFYDLIVEFGKLSGVPVLINTSFNTAGMPIVCTPQNALQCFVESELDVLVLGQCILEKGTFPFSQEASNVLMPPLKNELRFSFVRLGKRMWVYWNSMAKLLGKPFQYLFLFVFYFFVWGCTSMGLRLVKKFLKRNQNLSSWAHLTSSTTCSDAYYQS